ncbi:hypothetical protein Y032_0065g3687 [Ancylostoma ceylanicum]|uniref:Uncharacterized protein n=1 Tax=Ancylostoma ceylanicum TaxID=53326 RepID=A0A016U0R4_9BILA|nr:hypothetical protein Y032_0065g3687 [Ancylostoma ceylanicum]
MVAPTYYICSLHVNEIVTTPTRDRPSFYGSASSMETFVTARAWDAASSSYGGVSSTADYLSIRSDPSWARFRPTAV